MSGCNALGLQVSLEDFGTGYSSLDYFRRLPAEEIKIDRSFVNDMLDDVDNESIFGAIIGLSKNFSRRVVANGIENEQTQGRLLAMGCHQGQGFFYTKPLSAYQALAWAQNYDLQHSSSIALK